MSVRWITADVFDGLAQLDDRSVDLVVTSPPFLALRSYLPADHPDKGKEIGSEPTPAEFIDTMLLVSKELRRVLAPHGSICVELGDTYAGSGGAGGDYLPGGLREGQEPFAGSSKHDRSSGRRAPGGQPYTDMFKGGGPGGVGWPLAKSKTLIPQLLEVALAYGINPLTGAESPAGRWRIRNVVTWARPNPPVGALGDKWRPATSDVIVACLSDKRYWDDLATRRQWSDSSLKTGGTTTKAAGIGDGRTQDDADRWAGNLADKRDTKGGAPLLDYWEIPPGGYKGAHYAVFPPSLVVPLVMAMCPERVCRECGEPSRRIVEPTEDYKDKLGSALVDHSLDAERGKSRPGDWPHVSRVVTTTGWTSCGHDDYRPGIVLDPFAGSGTTLAVAHGHARDSIGIDIDERNRDLARERVGPFFFDEATT